MRIHHICNIRNWYQSTVVFNHRCCAKARNWLIYRQIQHIAIWQCYCHCTCIAQPFYCAAHVMQYSSSRCQCTVVYNAARYIVDDRFTIYENYITVDGEFNFHQIQFFHQYIFARLVYISGKCAFRSIIVAAYIGKLDIALCIGGYQSQSQFVYIVYILQCRFAYRYYQLYRMCKAFHCAGRFYDYFGTAVTAADYF